MGLLTLKCISEDGRKKKKKLSSPTGTKSHKGKPSPFANKFEFELTYNLICLKDNNHVDSPSPTAGRSRGDGRPSAKLPRQGHAKTTEKAKSNGGKRNEVSHSIQTCVIIESIRIDPQKDVVAAHRAKSQTSKAPTLARLETSREVHENDSSSSSDSEVESDQAGKGRNKKRKEGHSYKKYKAGKKKGKKGKRLEKGAKARPDQIAFYKGDTKTILNQVKSHLRVYLATVNPFPPIDRVLRVVRKAFPKACDDVLGHIDGGDAFAFCLRDCYLTFSAAKRPKLDSDMEKMVSAKLSACHHCL